MTGKSSQTAEFQIKRTSKTRRGPYTGSRKDTEEIQELGEEIVTDVYVKS